MTVVILGTKHGRTETEGPGAEKQDDRYKITEDIKYAAYCQIVLVIMISEGEGNQLVSISDIAGAVSENDSSLIVLLDSQERKSLTTRSSTHF